MITRNRALADVMDNDFASSEDENDDSVLEVTQVHSMKLFTIRMKRKGKVGEQELQKKWRAGITKEVESMEKCNVWSILDQKEIPKARKLVRNRWIFVQKRNGTFMARLVALGNSQIAGVNLSNHYSPVLCDTSFRVILLIIQKMKLPAWSMEVETAFLNSIWIEVVSRERRDKWFCLEVK
jgi:Reverse transcriptase (RNA-dependent DNA polymerase)